jgi:hypothetical protein
MLLLMKKSFIKIIFKYNFPFNILVILVNFSTTSFENRFHLFRDVIFVYVSNCGFFPLEILYLQTHVHVAEENV